MYSWRENTLTHLGAAIDANFVYILLLVVKSGLLMLLLMTYVFSKVILTEIHIAMPILFKF
jgi:hypothetical protein